VERGAVEGEGLKISGSETECIEFDFEGMVYGSNRERQVMEMNVVSAVRVFRIYITKERLFQGTYELLDGRSRDKRQILRAIRVSQVGY